MLIFKTKNDLNLHLQSRRSLGSTIGFVPTMGALHEGHLSLIQLAQKEHSTTVCSIFINPTQFTNAQDFEKYPITIEKDIELLKQVGCKVLFLPEVSEMYPEGLTSNTNYELGDLENLWEGAYRPGHFQGVCLIVEKLLRLVQPDTLFLGQKDFQQVAIIKKMINLKPDLQWIQVETGPTIREADGLAMSSRNLRLSEHERSQANAIYESYLQSKKDLKAGISIEEICKNYAAKLISSGFSKVDYVAFVDPVTMQLVDQNQDEIVLIVAAHLGPVRLIDNFKIKS